MKLIITNPLRWTQRTKLISILVVASLCMIAWLLTPTRRNIEPVPWIGRFASWPVKVFAWPNDRMGIVLIGEGSKMTATEIHGLKLYIDWMENPVIHGVKNLPSEFLGQSTEVIADNWFSRQDYSQDFYQITRCPLVLLEIQNKEVVAALGANQLIWRKLPRRQQPIVAHPPDWDWQECRYEKNMPIELYDCNPQPVSSDPNTSYDESSAKVACPELEVDSQFPYYLLTTNKWPIKPMAMHWIGLGKPHLVNAQPWLIIPNPFIHGESDACKILHPKE